MTAAVTRGAVNARAYLLLFFTMFCWGANAVLGRLAVGEISPMMLVVSRWLGVSVLLLLFARSYLRRDWPALRPRLPFIATMGVIGFAAFNGMFYVAAHMTTAVNIGIIQGSIPVVVLTGAFLIYRIAVGPLQILGVVVTMAGVAVVATAGDPARLATLAINFGDLLMIAACMMYAVYTLGLRKRPQVSALGLFSVMAFASFAAAIPMVAAEIMLGQFQWPTATGWAILLAVTLFPSFLAQVAFIQGVALIGPGRAGVFVNLVPVFAAAMAVVFLREPFEAYHAVALALVLGGIWLSERSKPG